jgi:translation initiation factor 1 (eIF-1/SUI1)
MGDRLDELEERIEKVLAVISALQERNVDLKVENRELKEELKSVRDKLVELQLDHNDQIGTVRAKLGAMLSRIEELETLGY